MTKSSPGRNIPASWQAEVQNRPAETLSLLGVLLDGRLLFGTAAASASELEPLWRVYFAAALDETARRLQVLQGDTCALPPEFTATAAALLEDEVLSSPVRLPSGSISLGELLEDFSLYVSTELGIAACPDKTAWGSRCYVVNGRHHHLLLRPAPVSFRPLADGFILYCCRFPAAGLPELIDHLLASPGKRQRIALIDLERGQKINLTRSEVFVHLERYLRRRHGLRLAPPPEFSQALIDSGLWKLEKG